MTQQAWVLGGGGHAKVVISTLQASGWDVVGCFDDVASKKGSLLLGVPILGRIQDLSSLPGPAVIGIGSNMIRRYLNDRFPDADWLSPIHPTAWVHESVRLGRGTVIFAGAIVQADSIIGVHGILNTGCGVDHDCQLGEFVHVCPGVHLSGGVILEDNVMIGVGGAVTPGCRIGNGAIIGAGATVISDIQPGVKAVGTPAIPMGHS